MSEVAFVLLSAFFLAIPVGTKYAISFQARDMLDHLREQERVVQMLSVQLEALESEKYVMRRAVTQVNNQRRQARSRRQGQAERLEYTRQMAERVAQRRRPAVEEPMLQMPELDEVIDMDEEGVSV
jgi:chromosome segregation ATPase